MSRNERNIFGIIIVLTGFVFSEEKFPRNQVQKCGKKSLSHHSTTVGKLQPVSNDIKLFTDVS
jgi:hypothetical protein